MQRNYHAIFQVWIVGLPLCSEFNALSLSLSLVCSECNTDYTAGGAEKPDAMDIVFKKALSVGLSGAVSRPFILATYFNFILATYFNFLLSFKKSYMLLMNIYLSK